MLADENTKLLRDLLIWTRASAFAGVENMLARALPDIRSRTAYQATDGIRSSKEIMAASGMGFSKLTELWTRSVAMGLMEDLANGKRKRLFDLRDFGLIESVDQPAAPFAGVNDARD